MNTGVNTMVLAARDLGMTIIPEGKCTFPTRLMESYRPTGIAASVSKLLRLARKLKEEGIDPGETGLQKLVVDGESFAEESRKYLEEIWGCPVYNTYGSTEGTICGECTFQNGLHVPEDLVHLDIYDPVRGKYVNDDECGRLILTTLLNPGEKCGTLLINYATEDTTTVVSRDKCECGRTHMRIMNPERETETFRVNDNPFNRVDIERGIFQRENMDYLTGEYESFLYTGTNGTSILKINMECIDIKACNRDAVKDNFLKGFLRSKSPLQNQYNEGKLEIEFDFTKTNDTYFSRTDSRPARIADYR
jgi:coenzyme F390 synthetase